jgi:hypothetical protein
MNKKTVFILVALTVFVWLGFIGGRYLQTQFMQKPEEKISAHI